MRDRERLFILDTLYGEFSLSRELADLVESPPVQRLRHIRLSNIDSPSMPGIANISRYEHALGSCFLATQMSLVRKIPFAEALVVEASALLHDWAITPFGHLVEEALNYLAKDFDHEKKLGELLTYKELGGPQHQLLYGREAGLESWSRAVFGAEWDSRLRQIQATIEGVGIYGGCVKGAVDLDNLDNLCRIAYHMGLAVDRRLPVQIASGIVACSARGPTFTRACVQLIQRWLDLRREVYEHLMLSRVDFAGKVMLIHATVAAFRSGSLQDRDWMLNDLEFLERLLRSDDQKIAETVQRWLVGEPWALSDLVWFAGSAPDYARVYEYSGVLSDALGRECFAYRIADKRTRSLELQFEDEEIVKFGRTADRWLLGVASPVRRDFTVRENDEMVRVACQFFGVTSVGRDAGLGAVEGRLFHDF